MQTNNNSNNIEQQQHQMLHVTAKYSAKLLCKVTVIKKNYVVKVTVYDYYYYYLHEVQ